MLLCNNTGNRGICLIKGERAHRRLTTARTLPILPAMSDSDELARRFFNLWAEYLSALLADPGAAEPSRQWLALAGAALPGIADGGIRSGPTGPPAAAATAAGAPGECGAAMAQLAR